MTVCAQIRPKANYVRWQISKSPLFRDALPAHIRVHILDSSLGNSNTASVTTYVEGPVFIAVLVAVLIAMAPTVDAGARDVSHTDLE
jgi:hypothetical protein